MSQPTGKASLVEMPAEDDRKSVSPPAKRASFSAEETATLLACLQAAARRGAFSELDDYPVIGKLNERLKEEIASCRQQAQQ
jgi:hypothetical protein